MGGSRTMEKRGHHICQVGCYQVRQKVVRATINDRKGATTPGSSEVSLFKCKNKLEGNIKTVQIAVQKAYDMLKEKGKETTVSKKIIKKYGIVV